MLRILALGTKMVFLTPDSVYFLILSSARVMAMTFSSSARSDASIVILERSLPLTCMMISAVSLVRYWASHFGHSSSEDNFSNISEAKCGAKGLSNLAKTIRSSVMAPTL